MCALPHLTRDTKSFGVHRLSVLDGCAMLQSALLYLVIGLFMETLCWWDCGGHGVWVEPFLLLLICPELVVVWFSII